MLSIEPGTLVFHKGVFDLEDSTFAIVVPHDVWYFYAQVGSQRKADDLFKKVGDSVVKLYYPESGRFYFEQQNQLTPLIQLFGETSNEEAVAGFLNTFRCFTYRDGSRHYREVLEKTLFLIDRYSSVADMARTEENFDTLPICSFGSIPAAVAVSLFRYHSKSLNK